MSPLKQKILNLIRAQGPISLSDYMLLALYDSQYGYYTTRDPLGVGGDFTTAPEISQIFGELLGAFLVQAWEARGRPRRFHLVELGPGRGTLMADVLRASHVRPGFGEAAHVTLVETSAKLRASQAKTLGGGIRWVTELAQVPHDAPLFLIANEFFDALPVRQYVRAPGGWHERMVAAEGEDFVLALAPGPTKLTDLAPVAADAGAVFEISPAALAIATLIAQHIAAKGGVAVIIDYGYAAPALRDTFQAVRAHARADPLAEPGTADLTAHVDFAALARSAHEAGVRTHGPVTQKAFLESLGIRARAAALSKVSSADAADIGAAVHRLTDAAQMGTLFKVMLLSDTMRPPTGFPA